jgi:glutamyl-tRNA synthetase
VVANSELDDLVLLRSDGIPTYNFGVIVDDLDMNISHVIRGDDHVNNTPRQINILKALDAPIPQYAHVPMILGADGERLSKRHGAVSVIHYREEGYLPKAFVNYLARLGWSHGDEEVFSTDQLIEWFDLATINRSPAKFNPEKLMWLNQHYLKNEEDFHIAELITPFLEKDDCVIPNEPYLLKVIHLLKERVSTISELADAAVYFFRPLEPSDELKAQHFNQEAKSILLYLIDKFASIEWSRQVIQDEIKKAAATFDVKLPKVAMPLRIVVTGEAQTPSIDAILELLGKTETLKRINQQIFNFPD